MENKELNYLVRIIRADGVNVDLVETEVFNDAKKIWEAAYSQWQECVTERKPYVVDQPAKTSFITAFDPSIIREVVILPVSLQKHSDNPYQNRMQKSGLSAMMGQPMGDLQDSGYL